MSIAEKVATAAGAVAQKLYTASRVKKPKLQLFKDAAGEWRYRVIAANGEIVVASEGYTRRTDARRGFDDMAAVVAQLARSGL